MRMGLLVDETPRGRFGPCTAPPEERRHPALFLDRDGTLIEDRGCITSLEDVVLLPGTAEALRLLQPHYRLVVITHQPWIARGMLTVAELGRIHQGLSGQLAAEGVSLAGCYTCPHTREQECACIKPRPVLGMRAAVEHRLDLSRSWSVGDHPQDVLLARHLSARGGLLVLTGHGARHREEVEGTATAIVPDLLAAAWWLLAVDARTPLPGV